MFCMILVYFEPGLAGRSPSPTEAQKLKSQADDLEDKSAQAIDDGNMDQAWILWSRPSIWTRRR